MIPKIIHQVWSKDSPIQPPIKLMSSWRQKNPDYNYHLWSEENVSGLYCQQQLDWTKRLCKRSDIIRLEMLYQYGGIYADCDFLCLKPFDDLLDSPFFSGYQTVYKKGGGVLCNALMGAEPHSPIIKAMLDEIKKLDEQECKSHTAATMTGPYLLTRMWNSMRIGKAYPPSYFYPLMNTDFVEGKLPPDWRERTKDAYALHFWTGYLTYDYINSL